jgi:hypothetical protein
MKELKLLFFSVICFIMYMLSGAKAGISLNG